MAHVQTPMIPVVGEWIAQHPGTISLGQGVVHYAAPQDAHRAALRAIENESRIDRYALVRGIDEFLTEIEHKVTTENQTDLSERVCVVTAGSNMGFLNAVLAVADVGDEIILLSPFYFNHEMAIEMASCRAVAVATDEDYQIDVDAIEQAITPRTRAIVTVSPSNPTGAVYPDAALRAVSDLCRKAGVYHISDEAYEYFTYGQTEHVSPASFSGAGPYTISLYTLSKAYGMAGWRCGYMVLPKHLESAVKKIQDTNLVCPPIINQLAGAAALKSGRAWCDQRISGFSHVRDLIIDELSRLGGRCRIPCPEGAFYALIQLDSAAKDVDIVETLIREFGVAVMPGSTFGVSDGCSIRIAYGALDRDTVAEGMGRLVRGLSKLV